MPHNSWDSQNNHFQIFLNCIYNASTKYEVLHIKPCLLFTRISHDRLTFCMHIWHIELMFYRFEFNQYDICQQKSKSMFLCSYLVNIYSAYKYQPSNTTWRILRKHCIVALIHVKCCLLWEMHYIYLLIIMCILLRKLLQST